MAEDEPLIVIRPSTAGYTRFCSEMYLENTEMSISPAREKSRSIRRQNEAETNIYTAADLITSHLALEF